MYEHITSFFHAVPFTGATWMVLSILAFFVWLLAKASKDPNSNVSWEDLIIDSTTNRTSPYKVGFLVGIIVSTWIMISFADGDKLTFDLLGVYLTYLVGGVGVSAVAKRAVNKVVDSSDAEPPAAPLAKK